MSQQPKTETDRLANVIQVLQLGQKTGRLLVERNEGSVFEQGTITFVNGQILQASVNQHQGPEALDWLRSWGHCRFAFSTEPLSATNGRVPTLPPQGYPAPGGSTSFPQTRASTDPLYLQEDTVNKTTGNLGSDRTPSAWLAAPYRTRHIEEGMRLIEQMGLSRTHRRLFLLIDGRRPVKELIRLMTHDPGEVFRLLQDLERAGVIQV
jgi:Domain of unknown function (DUF4388)